jgi:hypothetical protein
VGGKGAGTVVEAYARFNIDPETKLISISIIDATTQEVIREIPSRELIELARAMKAQADRLSRPKAGGTADPTGGRVINHTI